MHVLGRLGFRPDGAGMRRLECMIVPVDVCGVPAMPVDMDVPGEHGNVASQRCIKRVVRGFRF